MSATLQRLYQSSYDTLIQQRLDAIKRLEDLNTQISDLKREARQDSIELIN